MVIHVGEKIKEELYKQGMPVTVFAEKINRSRNVVYNIFKRATIDTDLLNEISRILNCDFFSLYSSQDSFDPSTVKNFYNEPTSVYRKSVEELATLQQQHEALQQEVIYLKKIIALLESSKAKK